MGKTRDLFKKIGDTKGPPDAKKSKIKEINGKRLRRGGKNTHKCTKKVLMTQITKRCHHSARARHPGV